MARFYRGQIALSWHRCWHSCFLLQYSSYNLNQFSLRVFQCDCRLYIIYLQFYPIQQSVFLFYKLRSDSLSRLSTISKIGNRENVTMFTLDRLYVTRHHIGPQDGSWIELGTVKCLLHSWSILLRITKNYLKLLTDWLYKTKAVKNVKLLKFNNNQSSHSAIV